MLVSIDTVARVQQEQAEAKYAAATRKEIDASGDDNKSIIPRFFVLQNYRPKAPDPKIAPYLMYTEDEEIEGFLKFRKEKMLSPYTKFEAEVSESNPKYVHIRCCYNNRYWVRQSDDSNNIVATAATKEEDQSKWSCTLFEPIHHPDLKCYQFRHVQLGYMLFDWYNLLADSRDESRYGWFESSFLTVINWDSYFIFPKYVTFKGSNDKYLRYIGSYLQFSGTDIQNPSHIHEIFPENDGTVRIRNVGCKKFWIRDPNWIIAAAGEGCKDDPNALFLPIKLGDNKVILRSMANNQYLAGLTIDGKTDCLNAHHVNPTVNTQMEVGDGVISRRIAYIEYQIEKAKIYRERVWTMAKGDVINRTDAPDSVQFTFTFEDKRKQTWTSTSSTKFAASHAFYAGLPTIGDGTITVSSEISEGYSWGETHKEKMLMSCSNTVTIPPRSKVKISTVVKKGFCDVPFSYTQTDTLQNGKQISHDCDDGIFKGVQSYDFHFKTDMEPLPV